VLVTACVLRDRFAGVSLAGDQLDAVSKEIMDVAALNPGNAVRLGYFDFRVTETIKKVRVADAKEGWVSFLRRTKIGFDPEMDLHIAAGKPASAALGEFGRLKDFSHTKQIAVKGASTLFFARGHRELDVIDGEERR
jgi:hypothetical protein